MVNQPFKSEHKFTVSCASGHRSVLRSTIAAVTAGTSPVSRSNELEPEYSKGTENAERSSSQQ